MNPRLLPHGIAALCCGLSLNALPIFAEAEQPANLIVHEWGVLAVDQLGSQPKLGTAQRYLDALPEFVIRHEEVTPAPLLRPFHPQQLPQDLEPYIIYKPVIHLYGEQDQQIELSIRAAQGPPIVYFPKPKLTSAPGHPNFRTFPNRRAIPERSTMTWKFRLSKERPDILRSVPSHHWWNEARSIPSDYIIMDDRSGGDRFLFYEGTTKEALLITAKVANDRIQITNRHSAASAPVILLINDQGLRRGIALESLAAGASKTISNDQLQTWKKSEIIEQCRKQWRACGMSEQEARGIVACWREELLDVPGMLLISKIPDAIYNRIFPLTIKPTPKELTRACLIFDRLPGQDERKHWLPQVASEGRSLLADYSAPQFEKRQRARGRILALGELITPLVNEQLVNPPPGQRRRLLALRKELAGSQLHQPNPPTLENIQILPAAPAGKLPVLPKK